MNRTINKENIEENIQDYIHWLFWPPLSTKAMEFLQELTDKSVPDVITAIVDTYSKAGGRNPDDFRKFLKECSLVILFDWARRAARFICESSEYNFFEVWDSAPYHLEDNIMSGIMDSAWNLTFRLLRRNGGHWYSEQEQKRLAETETIARNRQVTAQLKHLAA